MGAGRRLGCMGDTDEDAGTEGWAVPAAGL